MLTCLQCRLRTAPQYPIPLTNLPWVTPRRFPLNEKNICLVQGRHWWKYYLNRPIWHAVDCFGKPSLPLKSGFWHCVEQPSTIRRPFPTSLHRLHTPKAHLITPICLCTPETFLPLPPWGIPRHPGCHTLSPHHLGKGAALNVWVHAPLLLAIKWTKRTHHSTNASQICHTSLETTK